MAIIGSTFRRNPRLVDLVLILMILLVRWVTARELSPTGGGPEGEQEEASQEVPFAITASELGQSYWRVGTVALARQDTIYEAQIVDTTGQVLFKLKVDASTGKLLAKDEEPPASVTPTLLAGEIRGTLEVLLSDLSVGQVRRKGEGPFYEVSLIHQEREVVIIRVDPASRRVIPEGQRIVEGRTGKPRAEAEAKRAGEKEGEGKIIPRSVVVPFGWGSVLIMIVSSLYYSWKRSLYSPLRAAGGEAKARAVAGLRRTLGWHMVLGVAALSIAVLHVLDFTAKVQLSVSWLLLGMTIIVALSGAFGRFMARSEVVRGNWRRFHVPYTVLFFAVLLIHIAEKLLGN